MGKTTRQQVISATRLRKQLFRTLGEVQKGASVIIERDGKVVARLVPAHQEDWRASISEKPTYLVKERQAFAPLEDLWNE